MAVTLNVAASVFACLHMLLTMATPLLIRNPKPGMYMYSPYKAVRYNGAEENEIKTVNLCIVK